MDSHLTLLLLTLSCVLCSSLAWNSEIGQQTTNSIGDSNDPMEKRQLVPMPRIGRSTYPKRASLIPAPRIGRSDAKQQSTKASNAIDCNANPEMCENASGVYGGGAEDLVEPIDIQMRAAFIPRLGKRRIYMEEDTSNRVPEVNMENGGKMYHKLMLIPGFGYVDTETLGNNNDIESNDDLNDSNVQQQQQQRNSMLRALLLDNMKRAIPYTPRIGRAVFAPRIGKKATFVPRIG